MYTPALRLKRRSTGVAKAAVLTNEHNKNFSEEVPALERYEINELLLFASLAGRVLLENGAETYRAESTVEHILSSRGVSNVQAFVIPTAIFLSIEYENELYSHIERNKRIGIDLMRITRVNELSREFSASDMTVAEAKIKLNDIKKSSQYNLWTRLLFAGVGSSFFTLMYNGGFVEFGGAMIASVITTAVTEFLFALDASLFMRNIFGGVVAAAASIAFSVLCVLLGIQVDMNIIIIGAIMTMVPGVAITNAVRDSISGDYVSGMSRTSEAIVISVALVLGVAVTLNAARLLLGGLMP
jgi:uncharacterized membrane protein YjjP (DUF1212 family)